MTDTTVMVWVHFARNPSELYLATGTDSADTTFELTSQSAGASLGDVAGQVITGMDAQASDGSILTYLQITDSAGGQTLQVKGGERLGAGGQSINSNVNICLYNLSILVQRGQTLNALSLD